jgi:hypothetical protein
VPFIINYCQYDNKFLRVEILDLNGQMKGTHNDGNQIYLSYLNNGIYLLKVYTKDNVYIGKLIKHME